MTYIGAYLIGSQTLRLYHLETLKPSSQWIDEGKNSQPAKWTAETLRERMSKVFKVVSSELKGLVLVNSTQLPIELLRLAYDIGINYAKDVIIISATMARLQWAVAETKINYLNVGEKALVAYFMNDICEFDELEVFASSTFILNSVRKCSKEHAQQMLSERTRTIKPKSVSIVSSYNVSTLKRWFETRFTGTLHYIVEKPDYILLNGGLAKAGTMYPANFPSLYDIQDFASGYKIEYENDNGSFCEHLIPFNEKLPAKKTVELAKIKSFCIKYVEEITVAPVVPPTFAYGRFQGAILHEKTEARSVKVNVTINKCGVPYMKVDAQKMIDLSTELSTMSLTRHRNMPDADTTKFIVKLRGNSGSIWSKTDKKEYALLNVNQNEWTPFYISFHRAEVKIGEKAEDHSKKYPKFVIKDVNKVIGIPFKKIEIDRKWKFQIVPALNDTKLGMFEVETCSGPRQFTPDAIMSMFLMALKKLGERQFDFEIKKLSIQVLSEDYKPEQLQFIKDAAETVGIEVEHIEYMNF